MKGQANKHKCDNISDVGDLVWLRLVLYRQHAIVHHSSKKLAKHYFDPFSVLHWIGLVSYEL